MKRRTPRRLVVPALLILASGQAASLGAEPPADGAAPATPRLPSDAAGPREVRIQFTFKEAPFDQVLDFFARQTGLPVIREAAVPASPVTFISSSEYSLAEALDILNRMLFMHGVQVRREENFLLLTKLEDMRALGPKFRGEIPDEVAGSQIVTVVVPLNNALAAPLADQLKPLVSKAGGITPLPLQNALIIVDTAAQCRRLRAIIDDLDAEPQADAQVKVFALRHAAADAVFNTLKGLVAEKRSTVIIDKDGNQRTVRDESTPGLNLQPDARTNAIVAVGPAGRLATVEQLIAMLDVPDSDSESREMRTFSLVVTGADEAARQLGVLFASSDRRQRPTVLPIQAMSKVTVVGSPSQIAQAAQLLAEIDPGSAPSAPGHVAAEQHTKTAMVRLKHLAPGAAQGIAGRLLSARQSAVIRYTPAPDGRSLIVTGPSPDVDAFSVLLAQIDVAPELDREVRQVRVTAGDAKAIVARALELYGVTAVGQRDAVEASVNAESRVVTLVGGREGLNAFAELLRSTEAGARIDREVRLIELRNIEPGSAVSAFGGLMERANPFPDQTGPRPELAPVEATNSVLLTAQPGQTSLLEQFVRQLDQRTTPAVQVRVFSLSKSRAEGAAAAVRAAVFAGLTHGQPQPTVVSDNDSNTLVVSGGAEAIARAEEVVKAIDGAAKPDGVGVRTVALRHARAEAVAPLVESLLARPSVLDQLPQWQKLDFLRSQPKGEAPPVRVAAERRLNAVVVTGPVSMIDVAEQIIAELDVEAGGEAPGRARTVRVIALAAADAAEVAANVQAVFAEDEGEEARPTVRVDRGSNSIIVRGTDAQAEAISEVVRRLDGAAAAGSRDVRLIQVNRSRADAQMMAEALQRMMRERGGVRVEVITAEELLKTRGATSREERDRSGGDSRAPSGPRSPQMWQFALAWMTVAAPEQAALADDAKKEGDEGQAVTIAVDRATNSLVVVGPSRLTQQLAALAAQIESQSPLPPGRVRVVELPEAADARGVAALVNSTVRQLGQSGPQNPGGFTGRVSVEPDPAGGSLVVTANDEDFRSVAELIAAVARPSAAPGLTVKIYPLVHTTAPRAIRAISDLISPSPRGQQAQRLRAVELSLPPVAGEGEARRGVLDPSTVRLTVDPAGLSLIVAAPAEAIPLIDRFIALMDQSPVTDRVAIRRYELANARGEEAARLLQQVFEAARLAAGSDSPRPAFLPDGRTNSILVSATEAQHKEVDRLLPSVDAATREDGTTLAIIPLRSARPGSVRQVLESVLIGRDTAAKERVQITAADDSGMVVIRASEGEIERARAVIDELDRVEAGDLPVRSVKLERADAEAVARALQQFFDDRARALSRPGARARQRQVAVVGDRRSSTLLVSATDEEFKQIESLVATFDAPAAARDLRFKVIALEHAKANEIRPTVESLVWQLNYPPGTFDGRRQQQPTPDMLIVELNDRTNSVVIMGQGEQLATVERVIQTLDQPGPQAVATVIRSVRLKNADPRVVSSALQAATATPGWVWWRGQDPDGVRVEIDQRTRSLLLIGRAARVELAEKYAAQLDEAGAAGDTAIETLPLKFARAEQIAGVLQRFFADRARSAGTEARVSLIGSRDGNVLVVSAPADDMAIVKQMLTQMDQADEGEGRAREIFQLRNAEAAETARALQEQFPRGLASREGLVIVTPQPVTNSVIVSAPAELLEKVRALVSQIDSPPTAEDSRIVTVTLTSARAEDVADSLRRAVPKAVKVVITPVRRTNSLLLTGSQEAIGIVMEQVAKLDAQPARSPLEFRRILVSHADAVELASTMRTILARRAQAGDEPVPAFSATRENALLVSATADQFAEIERVIAALDAPVGSDRRTEFVPLRFAEAPATASALEVFYGRFAREAMTPGARNVTIIANPATRSLVISAGEAEWPGIRGLLEKLDNEEYDTARRVEILPLRHADAVSLAATLSEAFSAPIRAELERQRARAREQQGRRADPLDAPTVVIESEAGVTVVAERLTNSLVVSAGREQLDRIKAVAAQLDVPEFAKLPDARVIPLRTGPASVIAQSLRQLFSDQSAARMGAGPAIGGGLRSVMIVGEDRSNTLIVRADEAQFAQVKALADALEQEGDRSRTSVRVLRLTNVPVGRVAAAIRATFTQTARDAGETFSVEVDRAGNTLVIASSQRLFEQVRSVIAELDAAVPAPDRGDGDVRPIHGAGQSIFIIDVENNAPEQIRSQLEAMGVTRPQPADRPGVVAEPVTIVPLSSRRAVAVVASPADGQAVAAIVRSIDSAPVFADQEVAIVRLRNAAAPAVATAMESLLRPRTADAISPAAAALVEQVRRLNIRRDGVGQPDLSLDLSAPIRVLPEPQTNSILIASSKGNIQALGEVIRMLDRLPMGDAVVVRFFPLENASAQRLAGVIGQLFSQGDRLRQTPGTNIRGEPATEVGKALAGQVAVSVDDRTNALVVAGREEAVALVEVLVRQMDSDRAAAWIEPRILPLKHADATRLSRTLRQVLVEGLKDSPEAAALQRQVARIRVAQQAAPGAEPSREIEADIFAPLSSLVILPEEQLNALIVLGSPANAAAVSELVRLLDVPAASADNSVRIYPMRFAAADRVAGVLRDIFRQQAASGAIRPEDDLIISSDPRTNALIVSTSQRSFGIVDKLLAQLDAQPLSPTVGMHVIPVPGSDVTQLAPKIERLMRDRIDSATRAGAARAPSDTFSVQPEAATGSLIVVGSEENVQLARDLVQVLVRGAENLAATEAIDVVSLSTSRAEDLLPAVRELYADKENAKRGRDAVRVTPDTRLNALIVRGTADDVEAVRRLVQRLESAPVTAVTEIKRIELKRADAVESVRLLQNVLAGRPIGGARLVGSRQALLLRFVRERAASELEGTTGSSPTEAEISGAIQEQVTLTAEQRTNSVVVVAPSKIMVLIEELIADLDTTVAGARSIEIFRLKNADARAMSELLRDLFNLRQQGNTLVLVPGRTPGQPEGETPERTPEGSLGSNLYPVTDERQQLAITIDARTNSLLVSATGEYLEQVRKVVESLDNVEANEREQLVYTLRNTRALEVAGTLRQYFQSEANTLRQTLGPDRAGSLLRLLEREVTVQGDEKSNRLIVGVSPRYRDSINKIVEELDSTPPQVMIQVLLAEVTLDSTKTWGMDVSVGPFGGEAYRVASLAAGSGVATALGIPNLAVGSTDFELLIRALEVQGRLEVLSRPQILVRNNEPARIQVGENIAIVEGVERLENGNTRSDVTRRDIGIILNVTPSISADGFVSMSVQPEISSLSSRTTQISEDFQAPVIDTRQVQTNVSVRDGETIVIGGLIQTREDERKSKVPILGDIPIAGIAFQTSQYTQVKTELLVILTPRVIRSGSNDVREEIRRMTEIEIGRLNESDRVLDALPRVPLDVFPGPEDIRFNDPPRQPGPGHDPLAPPRQGAAGGTPVRRVSSP